MTLVRTVYFYVLFYTQGLSFAQARFIATHEVADATLPEHAEMVASIRALNLLT